MPYNLIIGIAGPYGAGSTSLAKEIERILNDWPGCKAERIHVATLIERYYQKVKGELTTEDAHEMERRKILQTAGTELRKEDLEFIGKATAIDIYERGVKIEEDDHLLDVGTIVFLVDSIKNINDYRALKRIYGSEFFLLFVHADHETRWGREVNYKSWPKNKRKEFEERDLVDSEEKIQNPEVGDAGQQVRKLASLADYYIVNNKNLKTLGEEAERFLYLLFDFGNNQPTIHERSMQLAFTESKRSFLFK